LNTAKTFFYESLGTPNTIVNQIERNYCINMTDKFLFCL